MKHKYFSLPSRFFTMKQPKIYSLLTAIVFLFIGISVQAQVAGPNDTSNGFTSGGAGNAWTNPNRIQADDTNYSTNGLNANESTEFLRGTNYGFAIPAGATINGIVLRIMRQSNSTNGGNSVQDVSVRLMKAGVAVGSNYANGTDWPNTMTGQNYGGTTDLWGTTWTPAEINANNFGSQLMAETENSSRTASVDFMQITVYYTSVPTITGFSPSGGCSNVATSVIITGTNFTGVNWVRFNGVNATSYLVNSSTQITAVYPVGTTTGPITVNTASGTATSATNFTVTAAPVVAPITGTLTVCPTGTTTLADATPGGTWSSANTAFATVNSLGVVTGVAPGNAVIRYTVTSGSCTTIATATVNVLTPTAVSGPSSVCIGNTIQMLPATNGTWISNNASIASIDFNTGVVTGLASGNATFTYTNTTTGCSSTTASVTVNAAPAIGTPPSPQSVCSGNPATFSVTATGAGLTYQWYKGVTMLVNGGNISGASTNTLTISSTTLADAATDYYCIVSGTCSPAATSNIAALTVTEAVAITSQPITSQALCTGNTASFSVTATGAGLTYQWYNGVTLLADGGNISGATTATLNIANLATTDASANYHCVVSGTSPCNPVTSGNSALIVNDGPTISTNPAATQTICSGDSVSFSVSANGGSLLYQWYKGATLLTNSGNISGATTPTLTINPANASDSAIDYHCVVSNGCVVPASSNNAELIVNERPFIFAYSTSICSEDTFVIVPTTGAPTASTIVPANTTYSWPAPVVTGGMTGGSAQSGQTSIGQMLTNPTNTAQTATYTVTPVSGTSGTCTGASFTVTVTVNPMPFVINLSPSVCSGENLTITPANGGGNIIPAGTTYSWGAPVVTGGMTGGSSGVNQSSFSLNLTNPTNIVQTASYNVTATSGSCVGSVFTVAVDVHPKPTVAASIATQTVCSGTAFSTINLSNPNGVAGTIDYSWTRNNTANLTGMSNTGNGSVISGTLNNTTNTQQITTFTIHATSDQSCSSTTITVNVVVDPVPTVAATPATQTICSGSAIANINFSNPNNVAGTIYTWTRTNTANLGGIAASGNGTTINGFLINSTLVQQSTTFTISATANGCGTNTTTVTVIVNPQPDVAATPLTQTLCGGTPIAPIVISNPNGLSGTTFSWIRNNTVNLTGIANSGTAATINGTLINTTNTDQTTTFTIAATSAGCPSTPITVDVVVKPTPLVVATPAAQGVCTGSVANIAFSTTNNLAGTVFNWTRDNTANIGGIPASGSGNISATVTNSTAVNQITTFTIIATAPNGCSKTITATLTVYPVMTTPGILESQVVCAGSRPTTFFITTPVTGGSGTYTYQWQSSTTSDTGPWAPIGGATNATYQPPTTNGTTVNTWYRVLITSCAATVESNAVSVVVANNSNFNFSIDFGTGTFCAGSNFNPRIFSLHGTSAYIKYTWIADPAYISPTTGGPIGDTGCLFGICLSDATLPLTTINNTNANVTTTISITPQIYESDGTFICSLSPQTTTITIRPRPTATYTVPTTLICSGYSAGIVVSGNITNAQMSYGWTRSTNANVTSSQASGNSGNVAIGGTYTIPDVLTNTSGANQNVTYTITPSANGCPGTPITVTITVSPRLLPGVVAANQTLCNGSDPVAFTQTTAATGGGTLSYQWQSSTTSATGPWTDIPLATGITYDAGPVTQTTWFVRVVTSTISGITCSVATTTPIQVSVNTIAPGVIAGTQTVCNSGNPVAFTSTTPGTGSGVITYQWQSNTTGCGGTFTNIPTATAITYDVPAGLLVTTYYRRAAISTLNGVPCTDYSNCITVFVNNLTGGTVGNDETLCGNNPSAFTEIAASTGAGTLTYQWQSNTTGCAVGAPWANIPGATLATYDAPAGVIVTTYYRRVTTSTLNGVSCTANSNCVTVTANSVTSGAIGSNRTVCMGGDPAAFTELTPASGTGLTYQWQISTAGGGGPWTDIPLATAATYDAPGPITVITYFRRIATATVNSTSCNAPSNFVTVFVNDVTPSVVAGDQSFCGTVNPNAFTVTTAATGNGTLTYQWQSNTTGCGGIWANIPGATSATYDAPVISQTTYYHVVVTSTLNSVGCMATSNCITVTNFGKIWNGSVNTDWNTAANWTPVGVPNATHCVVVPNTTTKPYVLGTNFDAYAYSLTILPGGALEVASNNSITVTDAVTVQPSGGFTIKNNASLVQVNNVANIGNIHMERITQPMYRYDYTYWGSPLTLASGFTLGNLSSQTQPDKYYSWNPSNAGGNGNWIQESVATIMNPNRGYIVRAPQTYSMDPTITQAYTANFIGVPNNGNINIPITIGALAPGLFNDKMNLIGNPYPSAVDADLFLNDSNNAALIDGTIYFWTHHSPPSAAYVNPFYGNFTYNYTAGDYATYTPAMGGTSTVPAGYGGPTPNGYIAAGQAFFVKGLASGNARFTNTMRDRGNNSAFFRMASTTERHRIWLNLANAQGGFSQTLVGYAEGATTGYDRSYDGHSFSGNFVSFYSVQPDDQTLTIQGRPLPFDQNDQVALGFHATAANTYTIGIDHFDGLFDTQNIYLEDKLLNIIHDLKQNPYSFTSEVGTFNARFILRFTNTALGVSNPDAPVGLIAIISHEKLMIQASEAIASVQVFDLTGKLIKAYKPDIVSKNFESDFIFAEGVYIAKIKLQNGTIVSHKLINNK